jgi:hypothetical protein
LAGVDFFQIAKRESHPKTRIQFLALGHLQSSKTKNEVAEMFQVSLTALRKWLLGFLSGGIDGLRPKTGKGRKRKLSSEREGEFRQQVEQLQGSLLDEIVKEIEPGNYLLIFFDRAAWHTTKNCAYQKIYLYYDCQQRLQS